jgi:ABC-2 type transport system ATP-binding protein
MRRRFGTTIVLTTHDLKDISATCDRLLVLDRGALLYDGSREGFERRFADERTLTLELDRDVDDGTLRTLALDLSAEGVRFTRDGAKKVVVECPRESNIPKVTALVLGRLPVRDLALQGIEIDTIVTRLYRTTEKVQS